MRLSAIAADDSRIGMITENGNVVGRITGEGTLGLVVFAGLASGLAMSLVLFALRTVLPARFLPLTVSIVLLGLGSPAVIDPGSADFTILGNRALNVAMFVALFPAFGCLAIAVAERFDRWLVRPPLVRLAPLTLVGTGLGCIVGTLALGILVQAGGWVGGGVSIAVTVLGAIVAFGRGRFANAARQIALVLLVVATAAGLVGFTQDVVTILR